MKALNHVQFLLKLM